MPGKSTHLKVIPQQSTHKHNKLAVTDTKKPVDILMAPHERRLQIPQGAFVKVSVPVGSILTCSNPQKHKELFTPT